MNPLELSVWDTQLILDISTGSVGAERRRPERLTTALLRQILPLDVHVWTRRRQRQLKMNDNLETQQELSFRFVTLNQYRCSWSKD